MNKMARELGKVAGLTYQQALAVVRKEAGLSILDDTQCAVLHMKRQPFCASDTRLVDRGGLSKWSKVYDCACEACTAEEMRAF